jgi:hypothetical protein
MLNVYIFSPSPSGGHLHLKGLMVDVFSSATGPFKKNEWTSRGLDPHTAHILETADINMLMLSSVIPPGILILIKLLVIT